MPIIGFLIIMWVLFGKLLFGVVFLPSFLSLDFFSPRLNKANPRASSPFIFLFLGTGPISTSLLSVPEFSETQQRPSPGARCLDTDLLTKAPFPWVQHVLRPPEICLRGSWPESSCREPLGITEALV